MTKRKDATVIAWHFLPEIPKGKRVARTRYSDESVKVGTKLTCDPPLIMCERGLHASRRIIDALGYAPGPIVCKVELSGEILEGDDKLCATERTVLAMADVTNELHEFGCWCAEGALLAERERGREPDARCWAAIEAKRKWLRGEITDQELAAAWAAAWAAAASDAAASDAAARAAAWAAAARASAAWDAAWAAARAAASDAAWAKQNNKLAEIIESVLTKVSVEGS